MMAGKQIKMDPTNNHFSGASSVVKVDPKTSNLLRIEPLVRMRTQILRILDKIQSPIS
jgi:hypothetical protein